MWTTLTCDDVGDVKVLNSRVCQTTMTKNQTTGICTSVYIKFSHFNVLYSFVTLVTDFTERLIQTIYLSISSRVLLPSKLDLSILVCPRRLKQPNDDYVNSHNQLMCTNMCKSLRINFEAQGSTRERKA